MKNGLLGRANVDKDTKIAFYITGELSSVNVSSYNSGDQIFVPIKSEDSRLNTINSTVTPSGNILIASSGNYMIAASLAIFLNFKNDGDGYAYVAINLEKSTDNGSSWELISGGRPIYPRLTVGNGRVYSFVLPSIIDTIEAGSLIRFKLYRTKDNTGKVQGSSFNSVDLGGNYGTPTYTLSFTKL